MTKRRAVFLLLATALLGTGLWLAYHRLPFFHRPQPLYGLLVFGPGEGVRVRLTVRDESLTLEQDGRDPRVYPVRLDRTSELPIIALDDPDGRTQYLISRAALHRRDETRPDELYLRVHVRGAADYWQYSFVPLAEDPAAARTQHFHGPLTVGPPTNNGVLPPDLALTTGEEPNDLRAVVTTANPARGCWVAVCSHLGLDEATFPDGVRPVADIEFPPKTPGGPPVRQRYVLDGFC
jgi:hypothetical protein